MSAVFWGHGNVQELLKVKSYVYQPCGLIKSRLFSTLCNVFWCSYRWTYCFARSDSSPILSLVSFFRGQVVTSRYHGSKISGYQQTAVLQICQKKQTKAKTEMTWMTFPSPYFPSIVRQCRWSSLQRKIVEIQKFCFHGDVTSHFSPLIYSGGKR